MTFQELNCFLTVADTLSYTKTAEKLYISQPAVSKYIRTLESELNTSLIDRSIRRAIRLTASGEILKESLQRCKKDFENALFDIQSLSSSVPIVINLQEACTPPNTLFQTFNVFRNRHEHVPIYVNFISADYFSQALSNGELIICEEHAIPKGKQYHVHTLKNSTVSYYIIASAFHNAFSKENDTVATDFYESPLFLSNSMSPSQIETYKNIFASATGNKPACLLLDSIDSTLIYLQANTGTTIVNDWSRGLYTPGLKSVKLNTATQYYLIWNPNKVLNSYLPELLKLL